MLKNNNDTPKDTPVIQQYKGIKQQHSDKLLFFHLGDFFEMYYEDAEIVAKTLGIHLTFRKNGEEKIFMCGVPLANKDFYIKKLLSHGFKVAICEQVETPLESKKRGATIVNRSVTAIYTAGTFVDENNSDNQYIMALNQEENKLYCFYLDLSTEDFFYERLQEDDIQNLLCRVAPKEILLVKDSKLNVGQWEEMVTYLEVIEKDNFSEKIKEFLEYSENGEINALKILFQYINNTYNIPPKKVPHMGVDSREITLDKYTIQNLDLFNEKASLYMILNKNITSMGKRKLRSILLKPLIRAEDIHRRLETVQYFYSQYLKKTNLFHQITICLQQIADIQKILCLFKKRKINHNLINNFLMSLLKAEELVDLLKKENNIPSLLRVSIFSYQPMKKYKELLEVFENTTEFFKQDFLSSIYTTYNLDEILCKIKQHHGEVKDILNNVKLNNNSIIGYFFEISQKDKHLMENSPISFMIRQTLLNTVRFTTKSLIELESNLIFLEEKRLYIKNTMMEKFLEDILQDWESMKDLTEIIGNLDLFRSLGVVAVENNYYKPFIINSKEEEQRKFEFTNARHVILEQRKNNFIRNDLQMNDKKLTFITGPNMGGKSTFMRTTALVVLMAQIGSFVAAEQVSLCPMNGIFVRIGYHDDPLEGESTFYKEMKECGDILHRCKTENIIVFFDEICRGTSYEEGIVLSKEIIKYLLKKKVYVLISSHYLELAHFLRNQYSQQTNILYTQYTYSNNQLVFLYKLNNGVVDQSFGVKVAEMAGLPLEIIQGAENELSKN